MYGLFSFYLQKCFLPLIDNNEFNTCFLVGGNMSNFSRRQFTTGLAAGSAILAAPSLAFGARPRVVVVGGGAGGATAARYIAKDSMHPMYLHSPPSPSQNSWVLTQYLLSLHLAYLKYLMCCWGKRECERHCVKQFSDNLAPAIIIVF